MEFAYSPKVLDLQAQVTDFLNTKIMPAEAVHREQAGEHGPWTQPPILEELKIQARARGLWNLFLPGEGGAGLTNLEYAPLAEISGRSPMSPSKRKPSSAQ